jgi:DNA mismatch repair ATPase MutS
MKALLMHADRDFDLARQLPPNAPALTQDLELDRLFTAMALGDRFLFDVAQKAIFSSLKDPKEIVYRQRVLSDCVAQPAVAREIYDIAVEAVDGERTIHRRFFESPETILRRSIEVLRLFVGLLRRLRAIADRDVDRVRSEGFAAFFAMLRRELDDEYFRRIEDHLERLRFRGGVLVSARLGSGYKGTGYTLRRPRKPRPWWWQWPALLERSPYTLVIADRDENGARTLAELRDRGLNLAANALAQSAEHILSFFTMLRAELGFYVGCLNLRERLTKRGEPVSFPEPLAPGRPVFTCRGLYDVCLSLAADGRVVGNDVHADGKLLVMITGANQGGKSTFLRSVGLAQLMMQAGMFVGAGALRASVCDGLFTHYKREEDPTMKSGKLDEELKRMSEIVDRVTPNSMLLFNESFSATNEREGAEIAGAIVRALLDAHLRVFLVTHSFELANGFYREGTTTALFLRAERQADGTRTFRLTEGEPLPTSYGADLYRQVFGESRDAGLPAAGP